MLAEWSAECALDAPSIVVPWRDPDSPARYYDLRSEPYDIAEIPEAEAHPGLKRALRSLNATRSALISSKCDAWAFTQADDPETLEALALELGLAETEQTTHGFASYIDLLWRERKIFASQHYQQGRLDSLVRRAQKLEHGEVSMQCTLRPAVLDLDQQLEGFAFTLYLTAVGPEPDIARRRWELAMEDVTEMLRAKEFDPPPGSATIEGTSA